MQHLLILLLLLTLTQCTVWFTSPRARGYIDNSPASASTTPPCGNGQSGTYTEIPYPVMQNGEIPISLMSGPDRVNLGCYYAHSYSDVGNFSRIGNVMNCSASSAWEDVVVLPEEVESGYSYLQFVWETNVGVYYQCLNLLVVEEGIVEVEEGVRFEGQCGGMESEGEMTESESEGSFETSDMAVETSDEPDVTSDMPGMTSESAADTTTAEAAVSTTEPSVTTTTEAVGTTTTEAAVSTTEPSVTTTTEAAGTTTEATVTTGMKRQIDGTEPDMTSADETTSDETGSNVTSTNVTGTNATDTEGEEMVDPYPMYDEEANQYYMIPLLNFEDRNRFVYVHITNLGSEQLTVAASAYGIPRNLSEIYPFYVDADSMGGVSLCLADKSTRAVFVTIFGPCVGDYEIKVQSYEADVDFSLNQERATAVPEGMLMFYYSKATSTASAAKRLTYEGSGASSCETTESLMNCYVDNPNYPGSAYMTQEQINMMGPNYLMGSQNDMMYRNDFMRQNGMNVMMNMEQDPTDFEDERCVELPATGSEQNFGTNYYGIVCTDEYEGTMTIERGNCRDYVEPEEQEGSSSTVVVSVALLLSVFF